MFKFKVHKGKVHPSIFNKISGFLGVQLFIEPDESLQKP